MAPPFHISAWSRKHYCPYRSKSVLRDDSVVWVWRTSFKHESSYKKPYCEVSCSRMNVKVLEIPTTHFPINAHGQKIPYFHNQSSPLISGHHRIVVTLLEGLNETNAALVFSSYAYYSSSAWTTWWGKGLSPFCCEYEEQRTEKCLARFGAQVCDLWSHWKKKVRK